MGAESECVFPTGKHFWSVPEPSGRQTCLWCPAVRWPEPVEQPKEDAADAP